MVCFILLLTSVLTTAGEAKILGLLEGKGCQKASVPKKTRIVKRLKKVLEFYLTSGMQCLMREGEILRVRRCENVRGGRLDSQ